MEHDQHCMERKEGSIGRCTDWGGATLGLSGFAIDGKHEEGLMSINSVHDAGWYC